MVYFYDALGRRVSKTEGIMIDPLGLNAAVGVARGVLSFIAVDTITPKPTDAAWPKWAVYVVAGGVAAGVVALSESDTCTSRCEEEKKRKKRCKKWGTRNTCSSRSNGKKRQRT